jgi:MoxR-like ATPase
MRMTEGYLPTADVVFLDEIWKAGPSIQNALLTVLNEKVYLNGKEEMRLPLKLVVAASNELPAEGENLDALWDRFLVRCVVGGIADKELFNLMISSTVQSEVEVPDVIRLSADELRVWAEGIDAVEIPVFVFSFVHIFRRLLTAYNVSAEEKGESLFYVSDRRWKKMVHLWRTSAFLNGCSVVHLADLLLLQVCVWDTPAQEIFGHDTLGHR